MALMFSTQAAAAAAVVTINASMVLAPGDGDVTTTWDVPRQDANGNWVVARPDDRFMVGVSGYTDGTPTWPADPGLGK